MEKRTAILQEIIFTEKRKLRLHSEININGSLLNFQKIKFRKLTFPIRGETALFVYYAAFFSPKLLASLSCIVYTNEAD